MHDREDALPVPVNVQMIICQPFGLIGKNKNQKIMLSGKVKFNRFEGKILIDFHSLSDALTLCFYFIDFNTYVIAFITIFIENYCRFT